MNKTYTISNQRTWEEMLPHTLSHRMISAKHYKLPLHQGTACQGPACPLLQCLQVRTYEFQERLSLCHHKPLRVCNIIERNPFYSMRADVAWLIWMFYLVPNFSYMQCKNQYSSYEVNGMRKIKLMKTTYSQLPLSNCCADPILLNKSYGQIGGIAYKWEKRLWSHQGKKEIRKKIHGHVRAY